MRLSNIALSLTAMNGSSSFARGSSLALDFLSGNNTLSPAITFSRTTNATLTNSAGLVANAPMNLLTFSEQFDNAAWTGSAVNMATTQANALAAPDGTATADKIIPNTTSGAHRIAQSVTVTAATHTYTVFAKSGEYTSLALQMYDNTGGATRAASSFNLSTGVATPAVGTASIASVGNGWFRCTVVSAVAHAAGATLCWVFPNTTSSFVGDGTSGIYIWGAQLEVGSTATTYNPTTVKNLLGFTEHFDNAAWTKSNAFVQTNLLLQSQNFETASWGKTRASIVENSTTAPDGTLTADRFVEDTATNTHFAIQTAAVTATTTYTYSVYIKANGRNFAALQYENSGSTQFYRVNVNLTEGTATTFSFGSPTGTAFTVTDAGNGWWRVVLTATASNTAFSCILFSQAVQGNNSYTGDGTSGLFLWGAQLVQGTSAGDYKATYAAAAAVGYTDIYGQPFAQKLVESATNSQHYWEQNRAFTAGAIYTVSYYAKAAEKNSFSILFATSAFGVTSGACTYTLSGDGTAVVSGAGATGGISSVGNGWYRCWITQQAIASVSAPLYTAFNSLGAYPGDGTSGIYIFGAQLSDSASVDPYVYQPVAAPSSVAYYGPRFDYDPVTLAPKGLLIEEQRTNLCLYSESFQSGLWTQNNVTDIANSTVAPNGTTTADTLVASAGTAAHTITSIALSPAAGIAASVYAKMGTVSIIQLFVGGTATPYANFDLSGGTATAFGSGTAASITPVGDGWYRCVMTTTFTVATSLQIGIVPSTSSARAASWTATGTETVFIWGAQLEAGAFATSYIPTVASQVTRAADSASMIGNNFARWFNQNEGSAFVDVVLPSTALVDCYPLRISGAGFGLVFGYKDSGTTVRPITGTVAGAGLSTAAAYKASGAYSFTANEKIGAVNGTLATPLTTTGAFVQNTVAEIGGFNAGAGKLNGTIKRIAYYNRRLSNTELQGITS